MWCRKRLDVSWRDLFYGLTCCCLPIGRAAAARRVEGLWSDRDDTIACLSVRSGLDLLLEALAWPQGDEVLVSAITIPDMPRIVRAHSLSVVPVDVDPMTATPCIDTLAAAIGPRTRAVIVAHLFGSRVPLEPIAALCRKHRLWLIEDCAQAYDGRYRGSPSADVSMFSFGTIKTATAGGGALLMVRDRGVLSRMRDLLATQPLQPRSALARKLVKMIALKTISVRPIFGWFVTLLQASGRDYDHVLNQAVRGFSTGDFFRAIRRQPSAPLLALMNRRIVQPALARIERRAALGRALFAGVRDAADCPSLDRDEHAYWVFPVVVDDPPKLITALGKLGFDATQGESLSVVESERAGDSEARHARRLLERIVFLPMYPELSFAAVDQLAEAVRKVVTNNPSHSSASQPTRLTIPRHAARGLTPRSMPSPK